MPTRILPILDSIDRAFHEGPAVPCAAGCTACCHGPFDISPAEAWLVVTALRAIDPNVAAGIRARAAGQVDAYRAYLPDWSCPHDVSEVPEELLDSLTESLAHLPCPALGDGGRCEIYAFRPSTCRLMGRPWAISDGSGNGHDVRVLENNCPIQQRFPGYSELPSTPLPLNALEDALEAHDRVAARQGWPATTIAAAIHCMPII